MAIAQGILVAEIVCAAVALLIVGLKIFGPRDVKKTLARVSQQLHLHG